MPNNYILLETIALTQSAASVTFDNLPTSGYTDLKIVVSGRTTAATDFTSLAISFNGSSANFTSRLLQGDGASVVSASLTTYAGSVGGTSTTASTFSNVEIYLPNYRSSNNKSFSVDSVVENNATAARTALAAGLWSQTAAITSIGLAPGSGSFDANSTFSLYGIAALGTTPVVAPKATGGNIVANDGTYWYHAFTSSGNFVPQVGLTADVLVVAGGGGGASRGNRGGGGGGAGGLLAFTSQALANGTNYACTIGAGGTSGNSGNGGRGVNSTFQGLTSAVGGGGGDGEFTNGLSGGSGGGGAVTAIGGANTSGQGNAGGAGGSFSGVDQYGAGGGGGASAAGAAGVSTSNISTASGGAGGAGSSVYSSWGAATSTGQNVGGTFFYAGGGGGGTGSFSGAIPGPTAGAGGNGGGAAGRNDNVNANAGIANTGGGGGGNNSALGGAGGSGIIIIRYPIAS